jgi:hypothetical protein
LNDNSDEELYAQQKKQAERLLKKLVILFIALFLLTLYFVIKND